jgi:hypothetical protein
MAEFGNEGHDQGKYATFYRFLLTKSGCSDMQMRYRAVRPNKIVAAGQTNIDTR